MPADNQPELEPCREPFGHESEPQSTESTRLSNISVIAFYLILPHRDKLQFREIIFLMFYSTVFPLFVFIFQIIMIIIETF